MKETVVRPRIAVKETVVCPRIAPRLERNRLRAILMDAVEVATARSKELGQLSPKPGGG